MAWQRKTPFGYMVQDGKTAACPEEADTVQSIFSRYLSGLSYLRIAEELSAGTVPYHKHTPLWNKNMVKRILENTQYLGTDEYPRLISNEDFLAVSLIRNSKTSYTHCPPAVNPIREKAVCAICSSRLSRNTRSRGRPRWVCDNPDCGAIVRASDDIIISQVHERLRQLANSPDLLTPPQATKENASSEAARIRNEINLCFNRGEINPDYIRSLIFAAAAEEYAALPDSSPAHELTILRERLEEHSANEADLQESLAKVVTAIRIGGPDYIELELVNGQIIGKEQNT